MIGFKELIETSTSSYNYYPARSTKVNRYFVIDMEGVAKDVVVTFTSKTKSGIADRSKRTWFCTVSAMRNKKGGLPIREVGDEKKFQQTLVKLVQEFMLKVRANAVSMRIQRKGSGKMFDMRIKTLFKKLRYGCETTRILNVGDHEMAEDYSFFVINKPGYDIDKLTEQESTINTIAAKMSKEPDISTARTIIVTADMLPGFEEYHDDVKAQWLEENPASRVKNYEMQIPELAPVNSRRQRERLEYRAANSSLEVSIAARVALGTLDIPMSLVQLSHRLAPSIRKTRHRDAAIVREIVSNVMAVKSREFRQQYDALSIQLQQDPEWSSLPPSVHSSLLRYTRSMYGDVNRHLMTGVGTEKTAEIIQNMDIAFEQAGVIAGNMKPAPLLYRGMECDASVVRKIVETGLFASTGFMSASTDPMIAAEFSETGQVELLKSRNTGKQEFLEHIGDGRKKLVFIIESDGLPVFIVGSHSAPGENEFIINRNTVYDADIVAMDSFGDNIVIRLSVRDKDAYHESVLDMQATQERIDELDDLALMLYYTDNSEVPLETREKFKKSICI